MIGSSNPLRWIVPLPTPEDLTRTDYLRFDKETTLMMVDLEDDIEEKIDGDLRNKGLRVYDKPRRRATFEKIFA